MSEMGVYQIKNIKNDKLYIGSSKNIENRWKQHLAMLRTGRHHSQHLQYAWDKYGKDSFVFTVLQTTKDIDKLFTIEQKFMDKYQSYNPQNGYNISQIAKGYAIKKEYDIDGVIQEDSAWYDKCQMIRDILNSKIENTLHLNPNMEFKYDFSINRLVYNMYLYFVMMNYDMFYDVIIFTKNNHKVELQSFFNFSMDLSERVIFNNEIDMIQICDQRYGNDIIIYKNNLIDWDVCVDNKDALQIQYNDGYQVYKTLIYDNTN